MLPRTNGGGSIPRGRKAVNLPKPPPPVNWRKLASINVFYENTFQLVEIEGQKLSVPKAVFLNYRATYTPVGGKREILAARNLLVECVADTMQELIALFPSFTNIAITRHEF